MNEVARELIETVLKVYIDDFLLATETLKKYFEAMRRSLELLVENKLELRIDKCKFL